MARSFSSGNFLQNNAGVTGIDNRYLHWAYWSRWNNAIPATNEIISQSIDTSTQVCRWFASAGAVSGYRLNLYQNWSGSPTTYRGFSADQTSTAWVHNYLFWDRGQGAAGDPVLYIDNALVGWTQSRTPGGAVNTGQDTITVGAYFTGTLPAANFEIGEVAFWDMTTIMSANDRQALADGAPAWEVRKDALVWSSRMLENTGDCNEEIAGELLTETGTCPYAVHPPVKGDAYGYEASQVGHTANNPIARWLDVPHIRYNAGEQFKLSVLAVSGQHEEEEAGIHSVDFTVTPPPGVEYDPASTSPGADVPYTHTVTAMSLNPDLASEDFPLGGFCHNTDSDGNAIAVNDFDGAGEVTVEATVYGEDGGVRDKNTNSGLAGLQPFGFVVDPGSGTPATARQAPRAYVDIDGVGTVTIGSNTNDGLDMLGFDLTGGDWDDTTKVFTAASGTPFVAYTPPTDEKDVVYLWDEDNVGTKNGWYEIDSKTSTELTCTLVAGPGIGRDITTPGDTGCSTSDGPEATIHEALKVLKTWFNAYDSTARADGGTVYCLAGSYDVMQNDAVEIITTDEWATITRAPSAPRSAVVFDQESIFPVVKLYRFLDITVSGNAPIRNYNSSGLADEQCFDNCAMIGYGKTGVGEIAGVAWNSGNKRLTLARGFSDYSRNAFDRIRITDGVDYDYYSIDLNKRQGVSIITLDARVEGTGSAITSGTVTMKGMYRLYPTLTGPIHRNSGALADRNYIVNSSISDSCMGIDSRAGAEDSLGPTSVELVRGMRMDRLGNDVLNGAPGCIFNVQAEDIGTGFLENEWHTDAWQYGPDTDTVPFNYICANYRCLVGRAGIVHNVKTVGHQDVAFVNMHLEQDDISVRGLFTVGAHIDHFVVWHCTFQPHAGWAGENNDGTMSLYGGVDPTDISQYSNSSFQANIFSRVKTRAPSGDFARAVWHGDWDENHYYNADELIVVDEGGDPISFAQYWELLGTNTTVGLPGIIGSGNNIAIGSPAQHGFTDFYPADLGGVARTLGACGAYVAVAVGGSAIALKFPYPLGGLT